MTDLSPSPVERNGAASADPVVPVPVVTAAEPVAPVAPTNVVVVRRRRRLRGPSPGFVLRTLLAAAVLLAGYVFFWDRFTSTVGDAFSGMVDIRRAEDVVEVTYDLDPSDAPLEFGSRGDAVQALQQLLAQLGFDPGTPDGVYGGRTVEAVRQFEVDRQLSPDGVADARTLAVLLADVGAVVDDVPSVTSSSIPVESGIIDIDELPDAVDVPIDEDEPIGDPEAGDPEAGDPAP